MKTKMKLVVVAVLVGSLAACASAPDRAAQDAADYGAYPANYEELVTDAQEAVLKDPQSAQNKYLSTPQKGFMIAAGSSTPIYGYRLCLNVNAKNSYGGYTGSKLTEVFIRNGRVTRYRSITRDDQSLNKRIVDGCAPVMGRFDKQADAQGVLKTEPKGE
ncbi:hypothetical protein SAMN04487926_13837 [Paraburkholderia steynii]|uniref:Lipoprotein n=1 Tax=Paraburkholderia steynii TaxID=1245441 RepID=A0A7Z7FNN2_9BURK|nr:hypothetical protein [Paraburkholderia steynii]SDJ22809.1 hypothetical protein SAMN04487926_13837 [Paraburkholderia steynii]